MAFDLTGLGAIAELLKPLIGLIPDPQARQKALDKMTEFELAIAQGQLTINAEEAKSDNVFVAGWRPACGWLCVGALGYSTIVAPALGLPKGDLEALITILVGMLGLGTMRSIEKVKGVK